jgi:hypothetical protein
LFFIALLDTVIQMIVHIYPWINISISKFSPCSL